MKLNKAAMNLPLAGARQRSLTFYKEVLAVVDGVEMSAKHAAMFGLDARIALAIFGALSVISGAALYSAIQQSRVTALLTELQEVGKAVEGFILDTGSEPTITSGAPYNLDIGELVTGSSIAGWQGPYLPYDVHLANMLLHPQYGAVQIVRAESAGTSTGNLAEYVACTAGNTCDLYANINGVPKDIAEALDLYVDGTLDNQSGRIIYGYGFGNGADYSVGYKFMPSISN